MNIEYDGSISLFAVIEKYCVGFGLGERKTN